MSDPRLFCPSCLSELKPDLLTEIYGYCCLNKLCGAGHISPNKIWYNEQSEIHRIAGPAIEYNSGGKEWCINGLRHREDGPAVECSNGIKEWWKNGKLHRKDGPAIEHPNGTKIWYLNGELNRKDGPIVEYPSGAVKWLPSEATSCHFLDNGQLIWLRRNE